MSQCTDNQAVMPFSQCPKKNKRLKTIHFWKKVPKSGTAPTLYNILKKPGGGFGREELASRGSRKPTKRKFPYSGGWVREGGTVLPRPA